MHNESGFANFAVFNVQPRFNAVSPLYWNTIKIDNIVTNLRQQGENIDNETLSHISLLPYKHVLPNGTYFIDDL